MIIKKIEQLFNFENVSVYGISTSTPMENEPQHHRPSDYLPEAKTIICFAIPLNKDIYKSSLWNMELIWRSQNLMYRRLDTISLKISAILEDFNFRALPVFGCMPLSFDEDRNIRGYINQIRMAELTGIGFKGKNGLILNQKYGSRLMIGGVITSASLPEIKPYQKNLNCPSDCTICSDSCPVNAIEPESGKVKTNDCLKYSAKTPLMKIENLNSIKDKESLSQYMNIISIDEHTMHICSECVSMCPYGD